jgi:predicted Fe-Mo cluster-binding NifX family protein
MKLAIPVSSGQVSTAFDFSRHLLLLDYEDGREVSRAQLALEEEIPMNRARRLESLGVKVLICGAISRALAERLVGSGIDVIPFVSGTVEEVLAAYLAGELDSAQFLMPGSTAEERREWRMTRGARPPATRAEESRP